MQLNEPMCIEVTGEFHVPTFQFALKQLLQRHEGLRCGFRHANDRVEAFVGPSSDVPADILPVSFLKTLAS